MNFIIPSPAQTDALGFLIGSMGVPGDIICLGGDLGAGKTTLTQSIARGAGVSPDEYVTSPTFTIMHEYTGRIPVYHMDLYRIGSADDVIELGLEDYMLGDGMCVIEWYERAREIIPDSRLLIELTNTGEVSRKIAVDGIDKRWQELLSRIKKQFGDRTA